MAFPASATYPGETEGLDNILKHDDEATTSPWDQNFGHILWDLAPHSTFWEDKLKFVKARAAVRAMALLAIEVHPFRAETPNIVARQLATEALKTLERYSLLPSQLGITADGAIGFAFIDRERRAVIEIYNDGEIVAGTYSNGGPSRTWETTTEHLDETVIRLLVHLTS